MDLGQGNGEFVLRRPAQGRQDAKWSLPNPPRVPNYSGANLEQPTLFHL